MSKRGEGRDEAIIDAGMPIIDTHHHLFDRPALRYMFEDYLEDAGAGHNVVASVYVETQAMARREGPEWLRPLGEVEFANGVAAMSASGSYGPCRVAAAIVGYADLSRGAVVGELLDRCVAAAPERFRGVRQITMDHADPAALRFLTNRPAPGIMQRPGFGPGLRELARRGLSFDAAVFHTQLPELGAVAAEHGELTIVLNHLGLALALDGGAEARAEVFRTWRESLRALARHPNVFCKVGGLGTAYWGFGFSERTEPAGYLELAAAWGPYVETAIEAFGASRCMMESNYPADARSCGFVPLWNALKHVVRDCSAEEKAALFHGTAARAYRIAGAGGVG
jgi:predicted TIM-barrel fold metal-dependent hydrolase